MQHLGFLRTPRDPNTTDLSDYFDQFGFDPDQVYTILPTPNTSPGPALPPPQAAPGGTVKSWLTDNSHIVLIGGAAVLLIAVFAGGRRR